jgi:hypothetical protein
VHLDDGGLVTVGIGIRGRATERLSPVSGESLNMVGVEAVAERMGDHVVGHHPAVPGVGKTAQAGDATSRLEDSLHASMMTILPYLCKHVHPSRWVRQWNRAALSTKFPLFAIDAVTQRERYGDTMPMGIGTMSPYLSIKKAS